LQDSAVGLDRAALEGLRQMILADGARQLAVGDLCDDDLADLAWSGNPAHLRSVAAALQRAAQGLEDYLVVRAPGGQPGTPPLRAAPIPGGRPPARIMGIRRRRRHTPAV
jgi:hypothetical protein